MLYQVLARMIDRGNMDGLLEKVEMLFASGRLTNEEYQSLAARL